MTTLYIPHFNEYKIWDFFAMFHKIWSTFVDNLIMLSKGPPWVVDWLDFDFSQYRLLQLYHNGNTNISNVCPNTTNNTLLDKSDPSNRHFIKGYHYYSHNKWTPWRLVGCKTLYFEICWSQIKIIWFNLVGKCWIKSFCILCWLGRYLNLSEK